ncbi:DDE_3 domain-containing protein, partial [Trichonephila clavipes]
MIMHDLTELGLLRSIWRITVLERMEWPARSPDLNPIEHLWGYLGREVAALNPPPRSLHELKQGLLCVWSSLPYSGVRQLNKQHGKSMPPMHS